MIDEFWLNAVYSLAPTVLVGLIFWFVIRAIVYADRNERKVQQKVEIEERAKFAARRKLTDE